MEEELLVCLVVEQKKKKDRLFYETNGMYCTLTLQLTHTF